MLDTSLKEHHGGDITEQPRPTNFDCISTAPLLKTELFLYRGLNMTGGSPPSQPEHMATRDKGCT